MATVSNPTAIARGQITIVDLNDGRSINLYLSSNHPTTQIFTHGTTNTENEVPGGYTPDWTKSGNALVITPKLYVSGLSGDQIKACVPNKPIWKINGAVASASSVGDKDHSYALTINTNMDAAQMIIECELKFVDPDTLVETPAIATMTFTKVINAGDSLCAVVYAINGTTISHNDQDTINSVTLHCDMWRGSSIDTTDVTYKWQKMNASGNFVDLVASTWGSPVNTNELLVKDTNVNNFEVFKCICADTDKDSPTYQTQVSDCITVNDVTDPYTLEVSSVQGTTLTKSQQATVLKATVWQNGNECSSTLHNASEYTWAAYRANADLIDLTQFNSAGHTKTGSGDSQLVTNARTLNVTKDMVSIRTTFVCTVKIP